MKREKATQVHSLEFEVKMTKSFLDMFKAPVHEKIFEALAHCFCQSHNPRGMNQRWSKEQKASRDVLLCVTLQQQTDMANATKKTLALSFAIQAN